MGIADLFRPKWKHSDPEVRANAVRHLEPDQGNVLADVARRDADAGIRKIAIERLRDPELAEAVAADQTDNQLRAAAAERAATLWVQRAVGDQDVHAAEAALGHLRDPRAIAEVARRAHFEAVRQAALARVEEPKALADVARHAERPTLRFAALEKIDDPVVLAAIAVDEERPELAFAVLDRIDDVAALESIAAKAKIKAVRARAKKQLAAQRKSSAAAAAGGVATRSDEDKQRHAEQAQLVRAVEHVVLSNDWAEAGRVIERSAAEWERLAPHDPGLAARFAHAREAYAGRVARFKEQQAAHAEAHAREAAARGQERPRGRTAERPAERAPVVETPEARAAADARRALIARLEADGEADGALLDEVRAAWAAAAPAGERDQAALEQRFSRAVAGYERRLAGQVAAAVAAHHAAHRVDDVVAEAERLAGDDRVGPGSKHYRDLVEEWERLSAELPEEDERRTRMRAAGEKMAARAAERDQKRNAEREENQHKLEALCAELESLAETESLRDGERVLTRAQPAFDKLGPLPSKPVHDELTARFQTARQKLFVRVQELREAEGWKRWANLPGKEALIKEAEALVEHPDVQALGRKLKALQAAWKESGPVAKEKAEELWQRFKTAGDKVFDRVRAHNAQRGEVEAANLAAKEKLCEQVEAVADSTDFDATAEAIKKLQAQWKEIGPVPRDKADPIWTRFRAACDRFFSRRAPVVEKRRADQAGALQRKQEICERIEALCDAPDWDEAAAEVKQLQQEWRTLGLVPRKDAEPVRKRFQVAADRFFQGRVEREAARRAGRAAERTELVDRLEELLAGDPQPAEVAEQVHAALVGWRQLDEAEAAEGHAGGGAEVAALAARLAGLEARAIERCPEAFAGSELDPEVSRRKREKLCVRVEELAASAGGEGAAPAEAAEPSAEQIAERLRAALAQNALGGTMRSSPRDVGEQVRGLQESWRKVGPVPGTAGAELQARFDRACEQAMKGERR